MDVDSEEEEEELPLAPLPPGAKSIRSHDILPDLYLISGHSKIPEAHGDTVMAVYDWRKKAMRKLFENGAKMRPPANEVEAEDEGVSQLSHFLQTLF